MQKIDKRITIITVGLVLWFVIAIPLINAAYKPPKEVKPKLSTENASAYYCITNYQWFKDTHKDVYETGIKISDLQEQIAQFKYDNPDASKWTKEQHDSYNMMIVTLNQAKNHKEELTNQYNTRAKNLHNIPCKETPLTI